MKRNVLIVYPGINLHNQAQAGGLEHLLSNVQGYASNNCRTFIICAYNNKILHKDKSGNIYFNIIYSRSSVYSGIAESTKKSTKKCLI